VVDLVDGIRLEIVERLRQLKPFVDEYGRLEAAFTTLVALDDSSARTLEVGQRRRPHQDAFFSVVGSGRGPRTDKERVDRFIYWLNREFPLDPNARHFWADLATYARRDELVARTPRERRKGGPFRFALGEPGALERDLAVVEWSGKSARRWEKAT
jgi:hypothetical protein